jgi:hypothetical protein
MASSNRLAMKAKKGIKTDDERVESIVDKFENPN